MFTIKAEVTIQAPTTVEVENKLYDELSEVIQHYLGKHPKGSTIHEIETYLLALKYQLDRMTFFVDDNEDEFASLLIVPASC